MSLLAPELWTEKVFIGDWTDASGGTHLVNSPATEQTIGSIGLASVDQVTCAARLAAEAQREWAGRPPLERAAILRRAAQLWKEHAGEVEDWLIRESGSTRDKAEVETQAAANECNEAAALPTHTRGDVLADNDGRWSFTRRIPAGVVTVISPFNYPIVLAIRSVAPALALGNAVLLKPDPRTTISGGVALIRIFQEAGLPDGVLSLLPGGAEVGAAVVSAPEVRVVAFTGSTAAGRAVGELGARHMKRVHLELGGNNALIVLPEADVEKAAGAASFGSFMHQGQICMATGRHLVHDSIYDAFVSALSARARNLPVGDPLVGPAKIGPLIDRVQLERVDGLVQATAAAGARVTAGGTFRDLFYAPTVISEITSEMPAWESEIFGPVAPVARFSTIDEAVALASRSEYGLSLGIMGNVASAMQIADAVPSGMIHINGQTIADGAHIPFGGIRDSGTGSRVGGAQANIESFTESQWVTVSPSIADYGF